MQVGSRGRRERGNVLLPPVLCSPLMCTAPRLAASAVVRPTLANAYTGWGLDVSPEGAAAAAKCMEASALCPPAATWPQCMPPPAPPCLPADSVALPGRVPQAQAGGRGRGVHDPQWVCWAWQERVGAKQLRSCRPVPLPCELWAIGVAVDGQEASGGQQAGRGARPACTPLFMPN